MFRDKSCWDRPKHEGHPHHRRRNQGPPARHRRGLPAAASLGSSAARDHLVINMSLLNRKVVRGQKPTVHAVCAANAMCSAAVPSQTHRPRPPRRPRRPQHAVRARSGKCAVRVPRRDDTVVKCRRRDGRERCRRHELRQALVLVQARSHFLPARTCT